MKFKQYESFGKGKKEKETLPKLVVDLALVGVAASVASNIGK